MDSITLDQDLNWAKILDPDPNSIFFSHNTGQQPIASLILYLRKLKVNCGNVVQNLYNSVQVVQNLYILLHVVDI